MCYARLMRRAARRSSPLLLALLASAGVAGYEALVTQVTSASGSRRTSRCGTELAVASARPGLNNWPEREPASLAEILADITRDERILGAVACSPAGGVLAVDDRVPRRISRAERREMLRQEPASTAPGR
jgi:hypothetical protein